MKNTEQLEIQNPINIQGNEQKIKDMIEGNENSIRIILNPETEIKDITAKAEKLENTEKQKTGEMINNILAGLKDEVNLINKL